MLKRLNIVRPALCLSALSLMACNVPVVDEETNPLAATNADPDAPIYGTGDGQPKTYPEAMESDSLGEGDLTVLMVVDRSSSMGEAWDGASKWDIAVQALSHAIDGVETELTAGALLFPQPGGCEVAPLTDARQIQFQRGDLFRDEWETSLSYPSGSTPLGEAFRQADAALATAEAQGLLDGRFRIVLVTDGEPSCGENPDDLVQMADSWRERGVQVRVMGLPGSTEAADLLDRIAGKEITALEGDGEEIVPQSTWSPDSDDNDQGYVAPENQDEVDDSFFVVVR